MASPMTATRRILSSFLVAALVAAPISLLPTVASAEDAPAEVVATEPTPVVEEPAAPVEPAPVVEAPAAPAVTPTPTPTASPVATTPPVATAPAKKSISKPRATAAACRFDSGLGLPSSPTNVVATRVSDSVSHVTWSPPATWGDCAPIGYGFETAPTGTNQWTGVQMNGYGGNSTASSFDIDGRDPSVRYDIRVFAYTASGSGAPSAGATESFGGPGTPSGLAATPGIGSLNVTWNGVSAMGTVTYQVRYKLVSASTWSGPVDAATNSVTLTSLSQGSMYDLQVLAKNPGGSSTWSATANATPGVSTPPGVIRNASAVRSTSTLSLLRFTAPASWGSGTPNNIEFQRTVFGTDNWVAVGTTGTTTTSLNTPADSATRYSYRFRANAVGSSGPWVVADESFPVPSAPTAFTLTPGLNSVTAKWNAPTGALGTLSYVVSYDYNGGGYQQIVTDATTYTFENLTPQKTFFVYVRAVNPGGSGATTIAVQTAAAGPPAQVTTITALSSDSGALVFWTTPSLTGGSLVRWDLRYRSSGSWTELQADRATVNVPGLTNDVDYEFQVRAVTNAGTAEWSSSAFATPAVPRVPTVPRDLTSTPSAAGLTLNWRAPADLGTRPLSSYRVEYASAGSNSWTQAIPSGSSVGPSSYERARDWRIAAVTTAGIGAYTYLYNVTAFGTVLGAPTDLAAVAADRSIAVSWTAPSLTTQTVLTNYTVTFRPTGGSWETASTTATSITLVRLTAGVTYEVKVRANGPAGASADSDVATATPLGPPSAVTDFTVTPGLRSATLTWNAPEATNGSEVIRYDIHEYSGAFVASVTGTTVTLNNLAAGTTKTYYVTAYNGFGPSAPAPYVSVVPYSPPIAAPTVSASRGDGRVTINAQYSAPTGLVTTHEIQMRTGGEWRDIATPVGYSFVGSVAYTITGLENGMTYEFRVRHVNSAGSSEWSVPASATPALPVLASAPLDFTTTHAGSTTTFTWSEPESSGTEPITSYSLQYRAGGSAGSWLEVTATNRSFITAWTGLRDYRVAARTSVGVGAYSTVIESISSSGFRPAAPTALAVVPNETGFTASWTASEIKPRTPDVSMYRIEYRVKGTTPWNVRTTTAVSWAQTALTTGATYEVRVTAQNTAGLSPASEVVETTTGVPAVITGVTVTRGDRSAAVSWNAPNLGIGATLVGYDLQYRAGTTGEWVTATRQTATSLNVTGLTNGTSYSFRARAVNNRGAANWSAIATVTPAGVPDAPVVTSTRGDKSARFEWVAPATNGVDITAYQMRFRSAEFPNWISGGTSGTGRVSNFIGFTNGVTIEVQVRAVNSVGQGDWSASAFATPAAAPGTPAVTAERGDHEATLTWPTVASNGSAISSYDVRYRTGDGEWTATTDTTITGLANGTRYEFQVRAVNEIGPGAWSQSVFATPAGLPGIPADLTVERGDESASASWQPVDVNGGTDLEYELEYRAGDGQWATTAPSITGLTNGIRYEVRVRATNDVGAGEWSESVFVTPAGLPGIPVVTAERGDESASLTWPTVDANGSDLTGFEVRYTIAGGTWVPASTTTVEDLANGTEYEFQARVSNDVGTGEWSASVFVTPAGAPGVVDGFEWLPIADGVSLDWDAADDNGAAITEYQVEVSDGETTNVTTSTTTAVDITGLGNNVSWLIRIRAVNDVTAGEWVDFGAVTAGTTPDAPVVTLAAGDTQIGVSWVAPTFTGGSAIIGYEVSLKPRGSTERASTVVIAGLSTTLTGLVNSTEYEITVRALNQTANGDWSDAAYAYAFGFAASFTGEDGKPVTTVNPGDKVVVSGEGTLPGATVVVELHSDPISLGKTPVANDGSFRIVVTIPKNAPLGKHSLYAGLGMGGGLIDEADVAITVAAAVVAADGDSLAITGIDQNSLYLALWFALGAAVLGTTLLVTRRRRASK